MNKILSELNALMSKMEEETINLKKENTQLKCNALGVRRQTLLKWANGERRAENSDRGVLIKRAYEALAELWEDYMLNGKVNPVSGIFLGKNHFGYTDKQEVTLRPGQMEEAPPTPAELEEKYADIIVDEVTQSDP